MYSCQCLLLLWEPRYSRWRPAAVLGYCFCYINSFQFNEFFNGIEIKPRSSNYYLTAGVNGEELQFLQEQRYSIWRSTVNISPTIFNLSQALAKYNQIFISRQC